METLNRHSSETGPARRLTASRTEALAGQLVEPLARETIEDVVSRLADWGDRGVVLRMLEVPNVNLTLGVIKVMTEWARDERDPVIVQELVRLTEPRCALPIRVAAISALSQSRTHERKVVEQLRRLLNDREDAIVGVVEDAMSDLNIPLARQ